jgi:hypothetical protein
MLVGRLDCRRVVRAQILFFGGHPAVSDQQFSHSTPRWVGRLGGLMSPTSATANAVAVQSTPLSRCASIDSSGCGKQPGPVRCARIRRPPAGQSPRPVPPSVPTRPDRALLAAVGAAPARTWGSARQRLAASVAYRGPCRYAGSTARPAQCCARRSRPRLLRPLVCILVADGTYLGVDPSAAVVFAHDVSCPSYARRSAPLVFHAVAPA